MNDQLQALIGCRDALHEAAKQFRCTGDTGHAAVCERMRTQAQAAITKAAGQPCEYLWTVAEDKMTCTPNLRECYTLEQVYRRLLQDYAGWFVYRGGSHVALHVKEGAERLLLINELPPAHIIPAWQESQPVPVRLTAEEHKAFPKGRYSTV